MACDVHLESLMHLSAFSAAVAVAYLGLDKVGESHEVYRQVRRVTWLYTQLLNDVVVVKNGRVLPQFDCDALYIIHAFTDKQKLKDHAQLPQANGSRRKVVNKWKRRNSPLFWLFCKRWDRVVVGLICLFSITSFIWLSSSSFRELCPSKGAVISLYIWYTLSLMTVFIIAGCSTMLFSLSKKMRIQVEIVDKRRKQVVLDVMESYENERRNLEGKLSEIEQSDAANNPSTDVTPGHSTPPPSPRGSEPR